MGEHERNHEHNLALIHQTELMTQINLIQDTVMILDEVSEMDFETERSLQFNMMQIEKYLDILDEVERGTAIAESKIEVLAARIKEITGKDLQKPLKVVQNLEKKLDLLESIESNTQIAFVGGSSKSYRSGCRTC